VVERLWLDRHDFKVLAPLLVDPRCRMKDVHVLRRDARAVDDDEIRGAGFGDVFLLQAELRSHLVILLEKTPCVLVVHREEPEPTGLMIRRSSISHASDSSGMCVKTEMANMTSNVRSSNGRWGKALQVRNLNGGERFSLAHSIEGPS